MSRPVTLALLVVILASSAALAEQREPYTVPRTAFGHPDLQGLWATEFLTPLERPPGVERLVVTPEQAAAVVAAIRDGRPDLRDPESDWADLRQLVMVQGEYRTSQVVAPPDGRMPFTDAGTALATRIDDRNQRRFDHPEQRPLAERCLENVGYPPIRTFQTFLPYLILQTRDQVAIAAEGPASVRMIHLGTRRLAHVPRSVEGHATGHWEDDTLVVTTTHFRADDPARDGLGRQILLSRDSRITERFTRVSEMELVYRYIVEDDELYTQPWTGEFSLTKHDAPLYEYACHEGNYSLPNILVGGQAEAARLAAAEHERN